MASGSAVPTLFPHTLNDYGAFKRLLLSGDVEQNPGPPKSDTQAKQLDTILQVLQELNSRSAVLETRSASLEKGQTDLLVAVKSVQDTQNDIIEKISNISTRLEIVESKASEVDTLKSEIKRLRAENELIRASLTDQEDRSRRNNLIFHGITDVDGERWEESEKKVLGAIDDMFGLKIGSDTIERAHRIGSYRNSGNRPIIVKFTSFKTRDLILQTKPKSSVNAVSVAPDFSLSTRIARKKLIEYGKALDTPFKVRYNKLYVKDKCFVYDPPTDSVREFQTRHTGGFGASNTPAAQNDCPDNNAQSCPVFDNPSHDQP
ncbi:uncharacterized protein LOC135366310 [Ornithodoros turicata]|uniref:uncharacterized protein LOC135366310 n=1 Tax=Ornithodoros turicata TaxID=34597 RepID=UPI003139CF6A